MPPTPPALRARFTNLAWQHDRDAELLDLAGRGCDVLLGVEGRDRGNDPVDVAKHLGPGWLTHQRLGDAEVAASFIAIRRAALPAGATADVRRWVKIADGHKATGKLTGLQDRYLLDVEVTHPDEDPDHLIVFHLPLRGTGKQDEAVKVVHEYLAGLRERGEAFLAAADVNMLPSRFAGDRYAWEGKTRWGFFTAGGLRLGELDVDDSVTEGGPAQRLTDTPFLNVAVSGVLRPASAAPAPPKPAPVPPKEPAVAKPYLLTHPPKRRQFRARTRKPTGLIVVHTAESPPDTVGPDTGVDGVAKFIAGRADPGSYHALADSDSWLQLVPYDQAAYGDGTGSNEFALHLSIATQAAKWAQLPKEWRDAAIRQAAKAAAHQARWVKKTHGIDVPAARVTRAQSDAARPGFISHGERDPGRRTDPGKDFPWAAFLQAFREEMGQAKPAKPAPALNHVQKAHVHLVAVDEHLEVAVRELAAADASRTQAKKQLDPLREMRRDVAATKKGTPTA